MPLGHQHLLAIIWCCLACALLRAQTPAPAIATVEGVVVAADTGQPLRKAQVRLVGTASSLASTVTDGDGRFVFSGVHAGEYTVAASKPSYLDMVLGSRRFGLTSPGTPFRVAAGQKIENIQLRLPKASVISGTITDEFGDPAFNTAVRVMRYVYGYGERYATTFGQQAFTDDRGTYRIAGLVPGEYVVSAVPRDVVSQLSAQREVVRDRLAAMTAASKSSVGDAARLPPEAVLLSQPIDPKGYVPVHYPGSVIA
jgi:protocatechuate 3,4-dioxygenase beta subunit